MRPLAFSLALLALLSATLSAAPKNKKNKRTQSAVATPAPVKTAAKAPATPEPKPISEALPSPWRTWSDASGRKVEAEFCALAGDVVTVRTKDGQTYRLALSALVKEDRVFAYDYAKRLRARGFADEFVKTAAHQIDFLIGSTLVAKGQKFNAPATDEQFVRRLYLDAIGRVPTAEEARTYLADAAPDKRTKLIDKLLYSPGYAMHMYNWMGDMLRVKDVFGKRTPAFTFEDWLKDELSAARPWDALVREMLTADGRLTDNGATGFLLYDAQMPLDGVSNLLTTFLGANVACAQCHDHPLADWSQRDFYQMAAFFGASDGYDNEALRSAGKLYKGSASSGLDKAMVQRIAAPNVFRMVDTGKQTLTFPKDYKYDDVKPGAPVTPSLITWSEADKRNPAYRIDSRNPQTLRDEFAKWMTHADNPRFAANIANRVWKKVFGLGVQEPVTDIDDPKKGSNPALLAHLATIIKYGRFDLREFHRVLFNSQTYQRAPSVTPDLEKGPYLFPGPLLRRMTAEQAWDSVLTVAAGPEIDNALLRRGDEMKLLALPGNAMTAEAFKTVADRMREAGVGNMGGKAKAKAGKRAGKGALDFYEGAKPEQRFGLVLARASELPQPAPETHFLRLFGQSDRLIADSSTTDGSVPQALMLMNGSIGDLVSDPNCAAVVAAGAAASDDGKIDSLYLSFLARMPTDAERTVAKGALGTGLGLSDVAWTLVNTREFLFIQ
ncbi:MAG: DUF1549 domain-containing protein [Chthoniobacteraceae bacterium]